MNSNSIPGLDDIINKEVEKRCEEKLEEIECLKTEIIKLNGGLTIGQTVWVIHYDRKTVPCDLCNNRVHGKDVIEQCYNNEIILVECPKCRNNGTVENLINIPVEAKVKQVGYNNSYDNQLKVWVTSNGNEVKISEIFTTLESCQAECDRLNSQKHKTDWDREISISLFKKILLNGDIKGFGWLADNPTGVLENISKSILLATDQLKDLAKLYLHNEC